MSDDYYSYAPSLRLSRPLALYGLPGAEAGPTARVTTMLTGLPLVRLAHRVSHVIGKRYDRVVLIEGHGAVRDTELKLLTEALSAREPPVIALSPWTLEDPELRRLVHERADLRYLRCTIPEAVERVRVQVEADPERHLAVRMGGPFNADAVAARLRFLDRLGREAPVHVEIGFKLPLDVGRALAAELEAA